MASRKREAKGFLLVAIVVMVLALYVLAGNVFIVREIVVEGNQNLSDADVIRMSGLSIGDSIFRVDAQNAMHNLASYGQAKALGVSTQLPDTVVISVEERTPGAYVDCYGVVLVLDDEGVMMERVNALPGDSLVYVTGVKPTRYSVGSAIATDVKGQVEAMSAALTAIRQAGAVSMVSELNVENPDNMYLIARSGMVVVLGNSENLDNKLVLASAAISDLQARGVTQGQINVRSGKYADFRA